MNKQDQKIKELEDKILRLQSSVAELKVLNEIAVSSGKAADIDQMLNLIVQKSIDAINAEQGLILLVTPNDKEPFKTIIRKDDTSSLKHNYHIGTNITGWVLLNKKPLIIENLAEDKRFNPTEEEKKDIKSILCVPIWFKGSITGLMMLINKKNQKFFTQNDLTLFSIISVQAGQLIKNLELQRESFQKRQEAEKLQKLNKIKTNFFTNISHEFRTPLTLILGPAKQILEQADDEAIKENARFIHKNTTRLYKLVNQLLDISRIEDGKMKLKTSRQNLVHILKENVSSFQAFAERKKINLNFNLRQEEIFLYLDRDKIEKILCNLISNALKFTQAGGCINIETALVSTSYNKFNEGYVEIIISDTGIGIPEEHLERIFDRFYQVDSNLNKEYEGTGIGLSLTKELVELHKGKIYVESEEGKGSVFKIIFPLGKAHLLQEEIKVNHSTKNESDKFIYYSDSLIDIPSPKKYNPEDYQTTEKPVLLIIEDNPDVRKYISGILKDCYKTVEACNGEEGLSKSYELIPDLIISDIMMPKIDGIQLCASLKSDERTSHIPLILLTAKAALNDKIEGLETGADDYIMKPFEAEELKVRIKNLLDQRKRIHEYFKKNGLFEIEDKHITPADQKFLQKAVEIINNYIADSSFNVEIFAENLAVSRSLLHKKLIALIGEPPGELIKRIRLNKAAKLIEHKTGNISEIALDVGFNNPSYFTECFRKQFGYKPSDYKQNHKGLAKIV